MSDPFLSNAKPFFQANNKQPFHLSVGVVLFDKKGFIACHHFIEDLKFENKYSDIHILMRESVENNEDIISTAERGLLEEFGAKGIPVMFLGSLSGNLPATIEFNKTTLYIAYNLTSLEPSLRIKDDFESKSTIEWHNPQELIKIMKKQGEKFHRIDLDEFEIIERALRII